jgi:alpha-L-fucosidase 2
VIRLLPALPAEWPDGSFRGLRARGGLSFDVAWESGRIVEATVHADVDGTFRIALGADERSVTLAAGSLTRLTP